MWYEDCIFYEVYMPAFCDGNGDGIGDFQGLISRLPYLARLGIGGIWLTPFYPSPGFDNGYDISNYYAVDPKYGTLEDFRRFLEQARLLSIRVIIDMVLNHTSVRHPWFQESRKGTGPYHNYYIWEKEPPNNWESFFAGSAWEYCGEAKEYYYHAFSREQACLNWKNPRVFEEMSRVLAFWLDLGVDGFRLDVINFLKVQGAVKKDNPMKDGCMVHIYDKNQPGILEQIRRIKAFVDRWPDKFLLGEVGEDKLCDMLPYVGEGLLDACFHFNLGSMEALDTGRIYKEIREMEGKGLLPTLFFTTHDTRRHFSRLCGERLPAARLLAMLLLTARGIPILYQGEELPMPDFFPDGIEKIKDIQGLLWYNKAIKEGMDRKEAFLAARKHTRDFSRKLLSWKGEEDPEDRELPAFYQRLAALRNGDEIFRQGTYGGMSLDNGLLLYERCLNGRRIQVSLNFSSSPAVMETAGRVLFETEPGEDSILGPWQGRITEKGVVG